MKTRICFFSIALLCILQVRSQSCIDEILACERTYQAKPDSAAGLKSTAFSYVVRATGWDDETVVSHVKTYSRGNCMNFFSDQATIYMDEKEMLVVMPEQKVLIVNTISDEMRSKKPGDDFYEMRRAFLDSCEVVRCETKGQDNKILELKAGRDRLTRLPVKTIVYDYNPALQKLNSVKIIYAEEYKIRQLVMIYGEYNPASDYELAPVENYLLDKKGNINPAFSGFEIVDNREKKQGIKAKGKG